MQISGRVVSEYEIYLWGLYECRNEQYMTKQGKRQLVKTKTYDVIDPKGYQPISGLLVKDDAPSPETMTGVQRVQTGLAWVPHAPGEAPVLHVNWTVIELEERELDPAIHSGKTEIDRFGVFQAQVAGDAGAIIAQLPDSISKVRVRLRVEEDASEVFKEIDVPVVHFH